VRKKEWEKKRWIKRNNKKKGKEEGGKERKREHTILNRVDFSLSYSPPVDFL
jgi:hypothetical protein